MTRLDKLHALAWTNLPLDLLSECQVDRIHQYVESELASRRSCHVPGCRFTKKERRRGPTNRDGWRWVAYVGPFGKAYEVGMCGTRYAAQRLARQHHASYFADFARSQIGGGT